MTDFAIIGGTGLATLPELELTRREVVFTPYGEPSGPITHGQLAGHDVIFLPRHGYGHTIPPHRVNYRANVHALEQVGAQRIVAVTAVGAIAPRLTPGQIAFPDQIIDYTYAREHTFNDEGSREVMHIDFSEPYDHVLRQLLVQAARDAGLDFCDGGVHGVLQGPRLETAAEIDRLERDGCDMVGMTGMPEAALARELGLAYAACALVANRGAGRGEKPIHDELKERLPRGLEQVRTLISALTGAM